MSGPSNDAAMVRPATVEDASGIAHVHVASWLTTYRGLMPDALLDGLDEQGRTERWRTGLAKRSPPKLDLVAELDGGVVGFCSGGPSRREDSKGEAEVYALYLLAEYQRRGIGQQLWQIMVRHLGDAGFVSLSVTALRDGFARNFYVKMGGRLISQGFHDAGGIDVADVTFGWRPLTRALGEK